MSNPLTKYVAAAALAGVVAFGGFTIAGAQDGTSTTTTPPATASPSDTGPATPPSGERPDGAGCDHDKGSAPADGTSTQPAPDTSSSSSTSSNTTNT